MTIIWVLKLHPTLAGAQGQSFSRASWFQDACLKHSNKLWFLRLAILRWQRKWVVQQNHLPALLLHFKDQPQAKLLCLEYIIPIFSPGWPFFSFVCPRCVWIPPPGPFPIQQLNQLKRWSKHAHFSHRGTNWGVRPTVSDAHPPSHNGRPQVQRVLLPTPGEVPSRQQSVGSLQVLPDCHCLG